jgi:hypothetical protein
MSYRVGELKRLRIWTIALALSAALLFPCGGASAAISASASYTSQQVTPGVYRYSVTLHNTGTTNIGTFWFGWVVFPPIYDLLPSLPSNVQSPAGWSGGGLNDSIYGGYSTEWIASTPLAPGQTLGGFTFDSVDSPSVLSGISPIFPLYTADTSWVYIGASQGDQGFRFQPLQQIPEPASLLLFGPLLLLGRAKR